jgi:predicted porin
MVKKFLPIVLAIAVIGTTGAAHAQTAIVLYGIADGGLRFDHSAIGTLKSMTSGGESQTRWGIRGNEDLGGGLKAIFNFEQDFDMGDSSVDQGAVTPTTPSSPVNGVAGSSRLFGRRAIVGLNSLQFGEIRVGRDTTPFFNFWVPADAFANGTTGRANAIAVGNTPRFDNAISYDTPSYNGFQFKGMVRLGESTTNNLTQATKGGGEADSFSLTYAKGPIYFGVATLHVKSAVDAGPAPLNNPVHSQTAGGSYDLGFVQFFALFFHTKSQTTKQISYDVGAVVPVGAWRFTGAVARVDNKFTANNSTLHNNDANFVALGVNYALSKRTDIYSSWSKFINQGGAQFVPQDQGDANGLFTTANVPPGFNPWSAEVGVRFLF